MRRTMVALTICTAGCLPPTTYGLRTDGALGEPGDASIGASALVVTNERLDGAIPGGEIEGTYVFAPGSAVSASGGSVMGIAHAQTDLRFGTEDPGARIAGHVMLGGGAFVAEGRVLGAPYAGGVVGLGLTGHDRVYLGGKVNPVGSGSVQNVVWWMQPGLGYAHRWDLRYGSDVTVGAEVVGLVPVVDYASSQPLYATQAWVSFRPPRADQGYSTAMDDDEPDDDEPPED
jgi:hypothetical protein